MASATHPAASPSHRPFFPLVDAARAFAALTVLVYHFIAHWDWQDFPSSGPLAWFRGGWMAVDLFFVISGFVIGLSALGRLDTHGEAFRPGFLRARLARIVPLHYVTLVAYVLLVDPALREQAGFWLNLGAHLLFVHNTVFDYYGAINGPNWSLGTEMQFYLLVALAAPWLAAARAWRIALLCAGVAWAWRWGVHAWVPAGAADRAYMLQTQLPGMLDEFAVGLLLARFLRARSGQALLARLASDARLRLALGGLAGVGWWAILGLQQRFDLWEVSAMTVFFRTAVACCAGLTLLVLCGWPVQKGSAAARTAAWLGQVSYGIYLWHIPVLFLLGRHTQLAPAVALAVAVPATVALAALTWRVVEQPALRRWSGARPTSAPVMPGLTRHPSPR